MRTLQLYAKDGARSMRRRGFYAVRKGGTVVSLYPMSFTVLLLMSFFFAGLFVGWLAWSR